MPALDSYAGGWSAFLDAGNEAVSDAEDIPERGEDFADSVMEKIESMMKTVEKTERVSDNQWGALQRMHEGILKWLH